MRAEENRSVGINFFSKRHNIGHLWVIDEDDVSTAIFDTGKWPLFTDPIAFGGTVDPILDCLALLVRQALLGIRNAL